MQNASSQWVTCVCNGACTRYGRYTACLASSLNNAKTQFPLVVMHNNDSLVDDHTWHIHVSELESRISNNKNGRKLYEWVS